jgi:hypothetical protein
MIDMCAYSVRDKDWAWPEKWKRWRDDFVRSERSPESWEATLLGWDGKAELESEVLAHLADWDWQQYKFDNLSELKGCSFQKRKYLQPSPGWDHDHCLGCSAKFMEPEATREQDVLHEGYVAHLKPEAPAKIRVQRPDGTFAEVDLPPEPLENGMTLEWVCEDCFEQFKQVLEFKLEAES